MLPLSLLLAATSLFPVLPPEETPRAELVRSLDRQADAFLQARAGKVARLATRAELEARRQQVRATLLRLMGGLPDGPRTPPAARLTGKVERPGFVVEKLIFETFPAFPVTANLYRPASGKGPFPALLASVGHGAAGKATELRGPELARRGFVVLTIDPMGQGERSQHFDVELGASRAGGVTDEHGQLHNRATLVGESALRYLLWDALRAVDYLAARPEVDANRLGATGCSGGGTVTAYLAALDPRIKAAAIGCYITSWSALLSGPGPQEAEQSLFRFLAEGLDMGDYLALIAPRPLFVFATINDFFPLEGARATVEEARRYYRLLGAPDDLTWFVGPGGHGTPREAREPLASFFIKHLRPDEKTVAVDEDPRLDPEDLECTTTGQVATSLKARTVADLVKAPPPSAKALARDVAAVSGVHPGGPPPPLQVRGSVDRPGYRVDTVAFTVAEGVHAWGLLALPTTPGRHPAVLLADPRLRTGGDAELNQLARAGAVVLALEPRGGPPGDDERPGLLGPYAALERRAEVLGQTLVGLRAADFIRAVDYLVSRPDVDRGKVYAFAHGALTVPMLHAAVQDPRIARLGLRDGLTSYRSVLAHSLHRNLPEISVPGVLRRYDLDDLRAALAPRRLILINPVDPLGQPLRHADFPGPFLRRGGPDLLLR